VRDYELVLVVSPDAGDEGFPATVERVTSFIQERGGDIKDVDQWGRRRLAYPIRRFTEGFYAVTHFSLEPDQVRALEGNLDLAEDVLRHLVVRQDPLPAPKGASRMAREALVAAGKEAVISPKDSALTPREEAMATAGEEAIASAIEAPESAEADAPSGKEQSDGRPE
jgi:small subunit ribosomal protein S6